MPGCPGLRTARAIRRLRPDPVPPSLIRKVCEAGTFAPSGGNRQPWIFVAVTEAERRAFVAERYRKVFRAYIAPAQEAAKAKDFPEATRRNMRAALHLADQLRQVEVALRRTVLDHLVDLAVPLGVEGGQGQVLELVPDLLHA